MKYKQYIYKIKIMNNLKIKENNIINKLVT